MKQVMKKRMLILGMLAIIISTFSSCVVETPRGYYARPHYRYQHRHGWGYGPGGNGPRHY